MNKLPEKAVLSYINLLNSQYEFEIKYYHGEQFLSLIVDISKMDYNHVNFDESYRKGLLPKLGAGLSSFINRPIDKIEKITTDIEKFFGKPKLRALFEFKNYQYLNEVEEEIQKAVKKTEYPEVIFSFGAESDYPMVMSKFYNWNPKDITMTQYLEKLENLTNFNIVDNYRNVFTKGLPH